MNAQFLERFISYRNHYGIHVTKLLLAQKIKYQFAIVGKRKDAAQYISEIAVAKDTADIFLIEARAAKAYWKNYNRLLGSKVIWLGRKTHNNDVMNK